MWRGAVVPPSAARETFVIRKPPTVAAFWQFRRKAGSLLRVLIFALAALMAWNPAIAMQTCADTGVPDATEHAPHHHDAHAPAHHDETAEEAGTTGKSSSGPDLGCCGSIAHCAACLLSTPPPPAKPVPISVPSDNGVLPAARFLTGTIAEVQLPPPRISIS